MEVLGLKITLLFVLSLTCFFFALIPLRIAKLVTGNGNPRRSHRQSQMKRLMSFLSCFGGGVFLCTCLLDLLPNVRDKFSDVFEHLEINTTYPIAEFVITCGFFLVLIIEQTALEYKEKSEDSSKEVRASNAHNAGDHEASAPLLLEDEVQFEGRSKPGGEYGSFQQECNSSLNVHDCPNLQRSISNRSAKDLNGDEADNHDLHSHSALRSLLLLLALSLHSVFEGLAMGLQTNNGQLLAIFTAVIIHKNILAFSLGMNLVQSHLSRCSVILSCLCFALMAPIGITLGIILIESFSDFTHSVMDGVLQGVATGTFLYITFFEVLPHEMNSTKDRLLKVLFLLLGFSTMAGLLFLDPS